MRRMLTDEELDARIEAMNDRDFGTPSIDESITVITVHGRLANVRYLEEMGAKKQSSGKYCDYRLEVPTDAASTTTLIRRLQNEQGIWFEAMPKVS